MPTSESEATPPPPYATASHWPLLGTIVDIDVAAQDRSSATRAEQVVCDEIVRLEQLFNVTDASSMLRRWIANPSTSTSNEFDELMAIALRWQRCSRGAFNVSVRKVWNLWAKAEADGCRPSVGELHELTEQIIDTPYRFDGHQLRQTGDCSGIDLAAIAQGFIVDLASEAAWRLCDLESLTVGAGGDLVHRGTSPIEIVIENPLNSHSNPPLVATVAVDNAAICTTGSARRGVSVGAEWISDVLDPRTGQPAFGIASVAVLAHDATTAGAVASILSVMEPAEGRAFIEALNSQQAVGHPTESFGDVVSGPVACWITDRHGHVHEIGG